MQVEETGLETMKVDENICGATCISDAVFFYCNIVRIDFELEVYSNVRLSRGSWVGGRWN